MSIQLDLFEPIHVALMNEAQDFYEKSRELKKRGDDLKKLAISHCPHEKINHELKYNEDEYGRTVSGWTEIVVECAFCRKFKIRNYDDFKMNNKTIEEWFHEETYL